MYKFYMTLGMCALTLSAYGASHTLPDGLSLKEGPLNIKGKEIPAKIPQKCNVLKIEKKDIATRGAEANSIEGIWEFQMGDYYFQDSALKTIILEYEATIDGNYLWFEDPDNVNMPLVATYDETAATVSFAREYFGPVDVGLDSPLYIYQDPFQLDMDAMAMVPQTVVATYDSEKGTLTFGPNYGIAWGAYLSVNDPSPMGYLGVYDLEGAYKAPEEDANWEPVGNATLMDGWVIPAFGQDQSQYMYEVPLQQNTLQPTVYRLVDPYHLGMVESLNTSSRKGYIVFDVADPDHVVFLKSNAGFAYPQSGIATFYCYNMLGYYMELLAGQFTQEEIIKMLEGEIPFTTFKDGIVSLGSIVDSQGVTVYDANFGYQGDPDGGYWWTDRNTGKTDNMTAAIYFPGVTSGISGIETGIEEPVYYNLQGMKVTNPRRGEILVKRIGDKSVKVVF